jgi:hypothetical protein
MVRVLKLKSNTNIFLMKNEALRKIPQDPS